MDLVIVALQFGLAGVLGVAAVGKFLDLSGSRRAMEGFGLPEPLAGPTGIALPFIELGLSILLLFGATARWAALAAALLFVLFIGGISANLRRGRTPDCHCFGQFHSAPAGRMTIARNALFTAMATIIAWQGARGPAAWYSNLTETSQVIVLLGSASIALLAWQGWLLLRLTRHQTEVLAHLTSNASSTTIHSEGPSRISLPQAHPFELPTLTGDRISLDELIRRGRSVLLLFVAPRCAPCRYLVPEMREWVRRFGDDLTIQLVSRGTLEQNQEKFSGLPVALQEDREVIDLYSVKGTPSGVLVSPDGTIRQEYAQGSDRIRELVARLVQVGDTPDAPATKDLAPHAASILRKPVGADIGTGGIRLPLPDLDGGHIGLDDLLGTRHMLLFFNPDCAFCQAMVPDLKGWEEAVGRRGDRLVIVSRGSEGANRALGLRSRLVIDDGFAMGTHYGATGTPSAVVIDERGLIASPIATGIDAVLDLLEDVSQDVLLAATGDD
jgi:thiol-disulfide isomerase/thioredoxin/uncharacterized membrane protein YphA (DoxX/SURF4 family)